MKFQGPWEGWRLAGWLAAALTLMSIVILAAAGTGEDGLRLWIRVTARTSLVLFLAAFVASSVVPLWPMPLTKWMLRNRRPLGVSYAVSHAFHLAGIVAAATTVPTFTLGVVAIVGGGLAYVFTFLMALTSFDRTAAWLGRTNWQRLHKVGAYYIWIIFAQSYIGRAVNSPAYIPFAGALVAALAVRFLASARKAAPRPVDARL